MGLHGLLEGWLYFTFFIYNIRQDNIMYGKTPVDGMVNE
jgi:hypothetical protein